MKQALIIGASGGIGQAIATALEGFELTLVGRDVHKLQDLPGQAVPTDMSSELEVEALFASLQPQDVIIYAAGGIEPAPLAATTTDAWTKVLDANLTGLFYTLKYADGRLKPDARLFVLGARPELVSFKGFGAYAAAKAGVAALVKVAAQELKGRASLTLVLPKAVRTDLWLDVGRPPKDALEPRAVADAIVHSLTQPPQAELLVG